MKQKTLVIEDKLAKEIEVLCDVMNANFSAKTKDLLVDWKITTLNRLKVEAPTMYEEYLTKLAQQG